MTGQGELLGNPFVDAKPLFVEPNNSLVEVARDVGTANAPRRDGDRLRQRSGSGQRAEGAKLIKSGVSDDHHVDQWHGIK